MEPDDLFWDVAEPLMVRTEVEEGTLMGHRCLRNGGTFAAMVDRKSGGLIVKLTEERVGELIAQDVGHAFAPAGKVFREWVLIPNQDAERWAALMEEAVGG